MSNSKDTADRKARLFLRFSILVSTFSGGKNSGPEETQTSMGYLRMMSTGGICTWLRSCSRSRSTLDCSCWSTSVKENQAHSTDICTNCSQLLSVLYFRQVFYSTIPLIILFNYSIINSLNLFCKIIKFWKTNLIVISHTTV